MSRLMRIALVVIALAGLGACATQPPVQSGQSEAEVVARLGRPTHVYQDGASRLLEYMHGPMGQTTDMARIGPDGRLVSFEQVLSMQKFAAIVPGEADKEKVLRTVGAPSETHFYTASQLESWSYPFKENGIWDSMMSVFFDKAGIVRMLQNGPDHKYDLGDGGGHM
ncbi:MAG: hypothetical protein D4R74_12805 [Betaproteobacteria bacterium]|nr:MAG: hypothetical protein D4R74_12805 [Betaproteobacteria bacterium]